MKKITDYKAFTLIELLVVITIIGILASIALPVYSTIQEKGNQTKALSNAKQIALACKLFAGDNGGFYPKEGLEYDDGTAIPAITESNTAFRALIPQYVDNEKIFYVAGSFFAPTEPDEDISSLGTTLDTGENHWAYVTNLRETSKSTLPLIADGFLSDTSATYSTEEGTAGSIWKGKKAVVIRVDMSGALENCTVSGTTSEVIGPVGGTTEANIFTEISPQWLSSVQTPVNPPSP